MSVAPNGKVLYMLATWVNDGVRVSADVKGGSVSNFNYSQILSRGEGRRT